MTFEWALGELRKGEKVKRADPNSFQWVLEIIADKIMTRNAVGTPMLWKPMQSDLLATDWELADAP